MRELLVLCVVIILISAMLNNRPKGLVLMVSLEWSTNLNPALAGALYNGIYGPKASRIQVYQRVGISQVQVYQRLGKSVIYGQREHELNK